jgi:hypothetical protein
MQEWLPRYSRQQLQVVGRLYTQMARSAAAITSTLEKFSVQCAGGCPVVPADFFDKFVARQCT